MSAPTAEARACTRCGEVKPLDAFYFVSRRLGTRRGQCKPCMAEIKAMQKDPDWRPSCSACGQGMDRFGPGRRLCVPCFEGRYDREAERENGSHRAPLKPCCSCGVKRLREDHVAGTQLCAVCRSISQSRRKRLKAFFNLTPREFVALLEHQRHECAICRRRFNTSRVPNVDHIHSGDRHIRGALCSTCNTLVGLARDNGDVLRSAAEYVEAPPAQVLFPGRGATEEGNRTREFKPRSWGK